MKQSNNKKDYLNEYDIRGYYDRGYFGVSLGCNYGPHLLVRTFLQMERMVKWMEFSQQERPFISRRKYSSNCIFVIIKQIYRAHGANNKKNSKIF